MKILITITFHSAPERFGYLREVVNNLIARYPQPLKIIIDTNEDYILEHPYKEYVEIVVHKNLEHPFHLTWCHRQHIKENIDNYDVFAYFEDDTLLPYENFLNYLENFQLLWPMYVPLFVRIEEKDGIEYISDIPEKRQLEIIEIGGKQFAELPFLVNYHGFWIMPQAELKATMTKDFIRFTDGREFAAMYVGWELGRKTLIEIEDGQISKKCYSYHLPNNYISKGLIKATEIFI